MKPYVRGKTVFLREVGIDDAQFILDLRIDEEKGRHLSATTGDIEAQRAFIARYQQSTTDFYFIISDWSGRPQGTIRIYDIQGDSFCWGSWIMARGAPVSAALESALLIYDFAFFSLHYARSHFDVRKQNERVVDFHQRFGAAIVSEDDLNYYFRYSREDYLRAREKYRRYLP